MCIPEVARVVQENVQSRRGFLSAVAFGAGAFANACRADDTNIPTHDSTTVGGSVVNLGTAMDLTHKLHEGFPTYFGDPDFSLESRMSFTKHGLNFNEWKLGEHVGTHLDAPLHFSEDGKALSELPLGDLIVPLVVIDIRDRASGSPDTQLTPKDIAKWISKHGHLPHRCCVAMQSGWSELVATPRFRGEDDKGLHFPGFHPEVANFLLEESTSVGIAVDTLSLDRGQSKKFETHTEWLPNGRWGLECLNLSGVDVPSSNAFLVVAAPKVEGASGGPVRAIAFKR